MQTTTTSGELLFCFPKIIVIVFFVLVAETTTTEIIQNLVYEKFLTNFKLRRLFNIMIEQQQEDKSGDELARKSVNLYHVMMQTSKALKFCQNSKEFFGGMEHVEAERLLLFACEFLYNFIQLFIYQKVFAPKLQNIIIEKTNISVFVSISKFVFFLKFE